MWFLLGLGMGFAGGMILTADRTYQRQHARNDMIRAARELDFTVHVHPDDPEDRKGDGWKDEHDDLYGGG